MARRDIARLSVTFCSLLLIALAPASYSPSLHATNDTAQNVDELLVVDCLLPGRIQRLGRMATYVTRPRPAKTTARDCEIRGGEYTASDRASYKTALKVWLADAKQGDPNAQTIVGEIYEKGLGLEPDYEVAAMWYQRAAEQDFTRAQINLAHLYEMGLGVPRNPAEAVRWYRKASGFEGSVQLDTGTLNADPSRERELQQALASTQQAATVDVAGPSIQIIDPPLTAKHETRGVQLVGNDIYSAPAGAQERSVIGQVTAPAGLLTLLVNERETQANARGVFKSSVALTGPTTRVSVVAIDAQGKRANYSFSIRSSSIEPPAPPPPQPLRVDFGKYYALIIGNDDYPHLTRLKTAINDAEAIAKVLKARYGFEVKMLENATRYDIFKALSDLVQELGDNDNLLIYYAGHGELDKANNRGHWMPVDAEPDNKANWISTVDVTDQLNILPADQVLVIADSCYSAALTRSALTQPPAERMTGAQRLQWLKQMAHKRARLALTSGGLSPVLDIGGGGHSVFANALLEVLTTNDDILEGSRLYNEVKARVAFRASQIRFEQVPEFAPVQFAGHEGGEFFLVPKQI